MKKNIYAVACLLVAMRVQAGVILSNPSSVPTEHITISQLTHDGVNLQSRHKTLTTDWKGIGQAFTWNTSDALDGVGMYIEAATFSTDQQHWFILSQLNGNGGPVTNTQYQQEFTMSTANVGAEQWIYFDIDDQAMVDGGYYAITVIATEAAVSGGNIISWACSGDNSYYTGGEANQIDAFVRGVPPSSSHDFATSANRDTVFYLQTIPEPTTLGLLSLSMCGILGFRRIFKT